MADQSTAHVEDVLDRDEDPFEGGTSDIPTVEILDIDDDDLLTTVLDDVYDTPAPAPAAPAATSAPIPVSPPVSVSTDEDDIGMEELNTATQSSDEDDSVEIPTEDDLLLKTS